MSFRGFGAGLHADENVPWWGMDLPGLYPRPEHYPHFSELEFGRRHKLLRQAMVDEELDALLIAGRAAMIWVSGYYDTFGSPGYILFPKEGEATIWSVYGVHIPTVRAISVIKDIRESVPRWEYFEGVEKRIKELKLEKGKIGIAGWDLYNQIRPEFVLPYAFYQYLLKKFHEARFRFFSDLIMSLAVVHSPEELRFQEKAAEITDLVFEEIIKKIKPGMKECEIWGIIKQVENREGGDGATILLGGS